MAKLLIQTQVYENYGYRWKDKGGGDYVVRNIDPNRAADIVNLATAQVEQDNEHFREHIIHWEVVGDDYLTEFEQSQLDYEGRIIYPANELVFG